MVPRRKRLGTPNASRSAKKRGGGTGEEINPDMGGKIERRINLYGEEENDG